MQLISLVVDYHLIEIVLLLISVFAFTIAIQGVLRLYFGELPTVKSAEDAKSVCIHLRRPIRLLFRLSEISPYVGILGTVLGILVALSNGSDAGQARLVALTTTAGGVTIAIVCIAIGQILEERVSEFEAQSTGGD